MFLRLIEIVILMYLTVKLWRRNDRYLFTRWLSACLILIELQQLANFFQLHILPFLRASSYPTIQIESIVLFVFFCYYSSVFLLPYIAIMGCIAFKDLISRTIGVILLVYYFQIVPSLYYSYNWFWLNAAGSLLFGLLFIGVILRQENSSGIRMNRTRLLIISFVPLLLIPFLLYIYNETPDTGNEQPLLESGVLKIHSINSYYNSIALSMIFIFVYFAVKYGKFGIKLYIEKQRVESSITAIKSGTAILNHAIKNELGKMDYLVGRIKGRLQSNNADQIEELLDRIPQCTNHLQQIIKRIQDKTGEISLIKSEQSLHTVLESVISQLDAYLEKHHIRKIEEFDRDITFICDPVHLQEAIFNLCMNAIDAMRPGEGILKIRMTSTKRNVIIEIQDNGKGIPTGQFTKVFEPFYTTKNHTNHFGLGLSYCHSVIRKHSGTIKITYSEINKGTTFAISFPKNYFIGEIIQ